jgi:hypothetical protein
MAVSIALQTTRGKLVAVPSLSQQLFIAKLVEKHGFSGDEWVELCAKRTKAMQDIFAQASSAMVAMQARKDEKYNPPSTYGHYYLRVHLTTLRGLISITVYPVFRPRVEVPAPLFNLCLSVV